MQHWTLLRPAGSAQLMIGLAREAYGLSVETCVAQTGLPAEALVDPSYEIEGRQELTVLRNILRALDPGVPFGLEAGLRYRATTHGMWGFGIIASGSLREALDFGHRFHDLTYSFNRPGLEIGPAEVRLIADDSDNPEDLRAALVERDFAAFITLQRDILGDVIPLLGLNLRAPRPAYASSIAQLFGVTPHFGASENSVIIDTALLDIASPLADPFAFRVCEEQCQRQLEQRAGRTGVAARVRSRILRRPGEFPKMSKVSSELGMSPRTLRNHLAGEGTSYRALLDEVRAHLAEELLSTTCLTADEIAARLGYADTTSFIAAFKRWKGISPRSYRSG